LDRLVSLKKLRLDYCESLTCLPDSLGQLFALRELSLICCKSLTSLPDSIGNLPSLRILDVHRSRISELPRALMRALVLEKIIGVYDSSHKFVADPNGSLIIINPNYIKSCRFATPAATLLALIVSCRRLRRKRQIRCRNLPPELYKFVFDEFV